MDDFILLNGNKKVMFSAPHSVEKTRDGKIKFSEPDTGEIAKELNLLVLKLKIIMMMRILMKNLLIEMN